MSKWADADLICEEGDVVQLDPQLTENKVFAACFLTVTEVYSWGVQGYVQNLEGKAVVVKGTGLAYYRAPNGTFRRIGRAVWILDGETPEVHSEGRDSSSGGDNDSQQVQG